MHPPPTAPPCNEYPGSEGKPMDRQEDQRFETIRLKVVLSFMWTVWTATTLLCFLIGAAQSFRRKKVLLFHSDGEIATVPLATFISSSTFSKGGCSGNQV